MASSANQPAKEPIIDVGSVELTGKGSSVNITETTFSRKDAGKTVSKEVSRVDLPVEMKDETKVTMANRDRRVLKDEISELEFTDPRRNEARMSLSMAESSLMYGDMDGAETNVKKAVILAQSIGDPKLLYETYTELGALKEAQGLFEEAGEAHFETVKWAEKSGDRSAYAFAQCSLSGVLRRLGREREALEHIKIGLKSAQEVGDGKAEGCCLQSLGLMLPPEQVSERLKYFRRAVELLESVKRDRGDPDVDLQLLLTKSSYARTLGDSGDRKRAIELFVGSIREAKTLGLWQAESRLWIGFGSYLIDLNEFEAAKDAFHEVLGISTGRDPEGEYIAKMGLERIDQMTRGHHW